ncbi:MAG: inorganic diphosphatase [Paludibacteraceae bacterium]
MRNNFNPWHQVTPQTNAPDVVKGIIEIPKGNRAKYELDKESGLLRLDRVLYSSMYYPHNYGFIPQSFCDDHDPLDILILSQIKVEPLCIVEAKVIGVMRMLDNGEADDKIVAVAAGDPSVNHYNDISELPPHMTTEIMSFFEDYTKLENKTVVVEKFFNKETAMKILEDAYVMYKKYYGELHKYFFG